MIRPNESPLNAVLKYSKRFTFIAAEEGHDVMGHLRGNTYRIGTIRARQFKRLPCKEWSHYGSSDYLDLVQSYAALKAAEMGLSGP